MTVQYQWYEQRILLASYSGILDEKQVRAALEQRSALLDDAPEWFVLVVDAREFEGAAQFRSLLPEPNLTHDARVSHAFIAISPTLFRTMRRAIEDTPASGTRITFVAELDDALALARDHAAVLDA